MDPTDSGALDPAASRTGVWPPAKRLGFRFLASYFALYVLPFDPLWRAAAPAVAASVFGIQSPLSFAQTGSGDTTAAYVRLFMTLVAAVAVTLAWSLVHRRAAAYPRGVRWLVVSTRYFLGTTMLSYGLAKVIPTQFMVPSLDQLLRTYGESSPMGIVWTFMGLSPAYTIFSGLAETVGGVLLFFRRTTTLGAVVLTAVLANVVMLNFAYDVPVKLFSLHLFAMTVGLLAMDAPRLVAVFWGNTPGPPAERRPLFDSLWANRLGRTIALLGVGAMAVMTTIGSWQTYNTFGNGRPRPELWGIHDVDRFIYDEQERPPLLTDLERWRALVVDRALPPVRASSAPGSIPPGQIVIWHMDGRRSYYGVVLDEAERTITAGRFGQSPASDSAIGVLHYERSEFGTVVVRGTWNGRPIEVHMRTRPANELLLTNRGFRWINEFPFNR